MSCAPPGPVSPSRLSPLLRSALQPGILGQQQSSPSVDEPSGKTAMLPTTPARSPRSGPTCARYTQTTRIQRADRGLSGADYPAAAAECGQKVGFGDGR